MSLLKFSHRLFFVLLGLSLFSSSGRATTYVELSSGSGRTAILSDDDSARLFDALSVAEHRGRSGSQKVFVTKPEALSIICNKSIVPGSISHSCEVKIDGSFGAPGFVFSTLANGEMAMSIPAQFAQPLYSALLVYEQRRENTAYKEFDTADQRMRIRCATEAGFFGLRPVCAVTITAQ